MNPKIKKAVERTATMLIVVGTTTLFTCSAWLAVGGSIKPIPLAWFCRVQWILCITGGTVLGHIRRSEKRGAEE